MRRTDRIPVETRFSAPVHTSTGTHPASRTVGTGSLSGEVKRPGREAIDPSPSTAEVKGRVELYLYSASGPQWPVLGRTLPLTGHKGHEENSEFKTNKFRLVLKKVNREVETKTNEWYGNCLTRIMLIVRGVM